MPLCLRRTHNLKLMHGLLDFTFDEKDYADPVKGKLIKEFFRPIVRGEPLTDAMRAMAPDPYNVGGGGEGGRNRDIPDVFGGDSGPWHVSERAKAIIEELEPGVHNFIPINVLKYGSKKHVPYQFYIFHTSRVIDAVIFEETNFTGGLTGSEARKNPYTNLSFFNFKCTLFGSKTKDMHLWRQGVGKVPGGGDPLWAYHFASNELVSKLRGIGAEGWDFFECIVK